MPIEKRKWITREMLRAEPDTLFVFGDNLAKVGRGGQAKEMRGEPNAVGLPTKGTPYSYLSDRDLTTIQHEAKGPLLRLAQHIRLGHTVVWPTDGIGTGLAKLPEKAPKIMTWYDRCLAKLEAIND